ncbi:kallikrein 1-related peptidase b24 preproprotein [Mus musculus]|uniref:Kallikrein 1-related peptidase b24 n=2 Tax=Mus musculus TaxID=10090 RepID=K1B24_MOUSE|nr:kallikrein 1-related peptidase b24 preproprotein [Mus musculus]Q61754.3 RecName: Full=Kallikrein 1-related peptidase b24; AltName: Full=Glandular kallikrein K24; Short=mGK-24; AltName: Full=Tissue kallikrein 24; Flags: Precursor [Mus musculus]AAI46016.1 Kallikrein 1-related peptidase b24 [Mus musculus]AAI46020.1 Kallikrein 1-related peptidase b24 [Mus musculus]BAA92320.1 glandular kallikrein 24 [Mus musculus]|eukprot:NP_034773.1 kallikrein 1-related peptidase b24 preproprotein [Mus musculus]
MWFLILFLALSLGGIDAAPPVQSRVVGGFKCEKNSQPWHVAVFRYNKYICGGVLLNPNWVLTAAHCYGNATSQYNVWLGKNKLFQREPSAQHRWVSKSFPHPDYNMSLLNDDIPQPKDKSNDLMLLRLSEPADITDAVKPIDLPTEEPKLGSTCLASGWGSITPTKWQKPNDLQCVFIKLLPNENCTKPYLHKVTDVMLCAGEMGGGKDTCAGDSGGPLICDGILHGITSWGPVPCGKPNAPAIYTKLIKFASWIKDTMAKNP